MCYGFSLIWQPGHRNWQSGVQRRIKTKRCIGHKLSSCTSESRTAHGNKTHLEHLNQRLKSNGCDVNYTACMIGQCLTELKHIYNGNNKLFICATKHFFTISYVYFFVVLCDLATTYYRMSHISLPLRTVWSKLKLMKEIVREYEDF